MTWTQEPSNRGFTIAPYSAIESLAEVVLPQGIEVQDFSNGASAIDVRARVESEKDHFTEPCDWDRRSDGRAAGHEFRSQAAGAVLTRCKESAPQRLADTRIETVSARARGAVQVPSPCLQAGARAR